MHYVAHLCNDKQLKSLLQWQKPLQLKKRRDIYLYLCASIMSQQLSVKVADIIYKRFLNLYGGARPSTLQISQTPFEVLRSIGLSAAKTSYVLNVAAFAMEQGITSRKLNQMDDEEVIAYLTQIKGVGRWTAEMLLMFALGREDVFSADDLGIQTAMRHLYTLDNTDKKDFRRQILSISQKWAPYRSYACMHLWAWKDVKGER
ncbi:MAG TPA: DNA-3-methyladenine glycosylase 2 family protein [Agriterribacter sp.]|uniref:DNA-3-methyladenine glycosylase family protein n=1 Tax=Agriterribacter sp. TaxID=2821509 RepID=UPI002C6D356A|nr:DNA-3-methyladenine glycosylase 2 family protein [Agriterribacter sp.]HRQ15989.1 DNA-3-methyladenine glycosylase 2 family protein [Agriterribacter sp.]